MPLFTDRKIQEKLLFSVSIMKPMGTSRKFTTKNLFKVFKHEERRTISE